jgi:hypothetical protein
MCQNFKEKLPGGPPILGFIAFLLTNVLNFAWGSYIDPLHPSPALAAGSFSHLKLHLQNGALLFKLICKTEFEVFIL